MCHPPKHKPIDTRLLLSASSIRFEHPGRRHRFVHSSKAGLTRRLDPCSGAARHQMNGTAHSDGVRCAYPLLLSLVLIGPIPWSVLLSVPRGPQKRKQSKKPYLNNISSTLSGPESPFCCTCFTSLSFCSVQFLSCTMFANLLTNNDHTMVCTPWPKAAAKGYTSVKDQHGTQLPVD